MKSPLHKIFCSERNIHGAWVVYGVIGVKQYYGYTKAEAKDKYKQEVERTVVVNE